MVKNLIVVGVLSLGLFACESAKEPVEDTPKTENNKKPDTPDEEELAEVDANRVLTLELEGMVCSMGCGGSIRKELNATGAVANCDFDFENERAVDVAVIQFDKNKITVDEIIAIVARINDGQFTVGKASSEALETVSVRETKTSSTSSEKPKYETASTSVGIPNIFDLFSGLFL